MCFGGVCQYCVHEDVSGVCVWLLEHERLSLAGLGAVLLVVHVLSTLTLHLALTTHFRVGTHPTQREHIQRGAP